MRIEHVAIWTGNLSRLASFYETYFQASVGRRYVNPARQFVSVFLTFEGRARLELMQMPTVALRSPAEEPLSTGYAHVAFSTGSPEAVDALTTRLQADGYDVLDGPRRTGDGYYESVVLDCDGNRIEITI